MRKLLNGFLHHEDGATALEYALLVVFIALLMAAGAVVLGGGLRNLFSNVGTEVQNQGTPSLPPIP